MAMTRQKWSVNGLSVELGLDRRAVAKMLDGCPYVEAKVVRGRITRLYHLSDVLRHLGNGHADEHLDLSQERAALARAQARVAAIDEQRKQLELDRLRGELLPVDIMVDIVAAQNTAVRSHILAVPSTLRNRNPGMAQSLVSELTELLQESLRDLAAVEMPLELRERIAAGV